MKLFTLHYNTLVTLQANGEQPSSKLLKQLEKLYFLLVTTQQYTSGEDPVEKVAHLFDFTDEVSDASPVLLEEWNNATIVINGRRTVNRNYLEEYRRTLEE